jgi:prevent-host-death family protein
MSRRRGWRLPRPGGGWRRWLHPGLRGDRTPGRLAGVPGVNGLDRPDRSGYSSQMKRVSVTDLKNRLSEFLRLVKAGETVEIMERNVPIARIEPLAWRPTGDAQLDRLVRDGIVTPPSKPWDDRLLALPPVPCRGDIVQALIEERGRD